MCEKCNCKNELLEKIITTFKEELESCEREVEHCSKVNYGEIYETHVEALLRQAGRTVKILERFREEL